MATTAAAGSDSVLTHELDAQVICGSHPGGGSGGGGGRAEQRGRGEEKRDKEMRKVSVADECTDKHLCRGGSAVCSVELLLSKEETAAG